MLTVGNLLDKKSEM